MATEYRLNYSAEQVEKRLDNAGNAILCTEQTLTPEQQEQVRKNIAAVGCLIGSSTEIAPSQVRQAILSGENVTISYIDDTFGTFFFSDFTYSEAANCLLCSAIVDSGESLLSATIYGNLEMDAWILSTNEISLKSDIPSAVNEALAQAKANGEFDGKDGTSVTVKSVSESTADGGSNVVTFSDGKTVTIKNGSKGSSGTNGKDGADGKTPIKGTDYFTEADKEEIVQQVIAALGTPVFGRVDAENNIILTGNLAEGNNYTVKYEDADGNTMDVGSIVFEAPPAYTNLLESAGYVKDKRLSSTDGTTEKDATGFYLTGYIPVPLNGVVRFQGINVGGSSYGNTVYIYDSSKKFLGAPAGRGLNEADRNCQAVYDSSNYLKQFTAKSTIMKSSPAFAGGYMRFGAVSISDDAIITVNEEIV